jgi:MFS family permease
MPQSVKRVFVATAAPPYILAQRDVASSPIAAWFGFVAMCVGMFMAILDIQIVATSLPAIQGALRIAPDQMSWIQTSYLIAEVISIPLTGFMTRLLSLRGLFTIAVAVFILASAGCAASTGFSTLILWRTIQGFAGGTLIPAVFSSVFLLFPARGQALATTIAGVLAVLAPTVGPIGGGWITSTYSWHWLFLVNIMPGLAATPIAYLLLPRTSASPKDIRHLDGVSLILLGVALASLEIGLKEAVSRPVLRHSARTYSPMSNRFTMTLGTHVTDQRVSLWVPIGLSVGPLVALGLARFAYALLLPAMRADLNWSYAQAGAMNAANAAGYLLGAMVAAQLASRCGARRLFLVGVFGTAAALIASGMVTSFHALLFLRTTAGFSGALAFVIGATLAAEAGTGSSRDRQGLFIAIYFAGAGLGVALSSLIVPLTLSTGTMGWRWGWIGFGMASLLTGLIALPAVRHRSTIDSSRSIDHGMSMDVSLGPITVAYALFGAGYIAYMTFIVAFLRSERVDPGVVSVFWTVLGIAGIVAGFCWGPVLTRLRGGWAMFVVLVVNACGALAPLLAGSTGIAFLSALLFGASVMAGPSAVTAFVRKARPPQVWTAEIGRLTVLFGLGQCVGPILVGAVSDGPTGIQLGLVVSVGILALASIIASFQREPKTTGDMGPSENAGFDRGFVKGHPDHEPPLLNLEGPDRALMRSHQRARRPEKDASVRPQAYQPRRALEQPPVEPVLQPIRLRLPPSHP